MSLIKIKNLKIQTIIGIYKVERKKKQDIILNIEMYYDSSKAALSDRIEDAVDYKNIVDQITDFTENSQFLLLEKLGQEILNIIMKNTLVKKAKVEIDKPDAILSSESVSVTIMNSKV